MNIPTNQSPSAAPGGPAARRTHQQYIDAVTGGMSEHELAALRSMVLDGLADTLDGDGFPMEPAEMESKTTGELLLAYVRLYGREELRNSLVEPALGLD